MNILIGLVKDVNTVWWKRFQTEVEKYSLEYKLIEFERDDWLEQIKPCTHIISRPNFQAPYLRQAREKFTIIEQHLKKQLFPDFNTFWHYDNKNAQKYLADLYKIKMPSGFVSYSYDDSLDFLKKTNYPIVSKSAQGAGSRNVRMLKSLDEAKRELDFLFKKGFYHRALYYLLLKLKLVQNVFSGQRFYVNYQEFLPDNPGDLRVTTVGNKYAYSLFRGNRDNDFRASGSGKIDYSTEKYNTRAIEYCLQISDLLKLDSACYDILFVDDEIFLTEFSYIFVDSAINGCKGFFTKSNDELVFTEGQSWPQTLITKYLFEEKWNLIDKDE